MKGRQKKPTNKKTDAFVYFDKGALGVQFTLVGFDDRGKNDLKTKFHSILERKTVTYRGRKEVPLTMIRSNDRKFLEAFSSWEADGRRGSPVDYLPQKDVLANESVKTMAMVLEHKYNAGRNPTDREWSQYLFDVYSQRQEELEEIKSSRK